MKIHVITTVLSSNPNVNADLYKEDFNFLYGALWRDGEISKTVEEEIIYIECIRIKDMTDYPEFKFSPMYLIRQYSNISFMLAREHCATGRAFQLSKLLKTVLDVFLECDFLSKKEHQILKREISETILDLEYSNGNDHFSSIRMIPFIKNGNRG